MTLVNAAINYQNALTICIILTRFSMNSFHRLCFKDVTTANTATICNTSSESVTFKRFPHICRINKKREKQTRPCPIWNTNRVLSLSLTRDPIGE